MRSIANVSTEKPVPYMRQLCKHFGHKIPASFNDHDGRIEFEPGVLTLDASAAEVLVLEVNGSTADDLDRLEHVVGGHLERFGKRDELCVEWTRDAA